MISDILPIERFMKYDIESPVTSAHDSGSTSTEVDRFVMNHGIDVACKQARVHCASYDIMQTDRPMFTRTCKP